MSDSPQVWIVVADDPAAAGLVPAARALSDSVVALVAGRREVAETMAASGVDEVRWFGEPTIDVPEVYAADVARVIAAASPRAVLGTATDSGRALLGAAAAALGVPVFASVSALTVDGDRIVADRVVFGGIAGRSETVAGAPLVAVLPSDGEIVATAAVPITEVAAEPYGGVTVVERRAKEASGGDIGAARTVVGVGRGLKAREDLALVEDLAAALGGELGCSRPLAEGVDWVAKERYIGISGQHIAPELYVAVGISGQVQHMVGVREATVVVAVNSDPAAPVFAECDYGIVGDLYEVLPALTAAARA